MSTSGYGAEAHCSVAFDLPGFVNLVWPHFLGGCELCRDTEKSLRAAGIFKEVDFVQPVDQPPYQVLPHKIGVLIK